MATKAKGAKKAPDILEQHQPKSDWHKLIESIREYPALYAAGALFIIVAVLAGSVYRLSSANSASDAMTQFAKAAHNEDPALRAQELEPAAKGGPAAASALYLAGEAQYQAKNYAAAKESFTRLRNEFPTSEFAADAVEGLGYIAENEGDQDTALASYKEIIEKWPNSVARRRQEVNIGRVQEAKGNFKEAVDAYKYHLEQYPESSFKMDAQQALDRLEIAHPELFPKEEPAPATEAPVAEAPVAEAPVAEAPAADAAVPEVTPAPQQ